MHNHRWRYEHSGTWEVIFLSRRKFHFLTLPCSLLSTSYACKGVQPMPLSVLLWLVCSPPCLCPCLIIDKRAACLTKAPDDARWLKLLMTESSYSCCLHVSHKALLASSLSHDQRSKGWGLTMRMRTSALKKSSKSKVVPKKEFTRCGTLIAKVKSWVPVLFWFMHACVVLSSLVLEYHNYYTCTSVVEPLPTVTITTYPSLPFALCFIPVLSTTSRTYSIIFFT